MTKKSSRNQRKNQRQRAGRAKEHGLPQKTVEEKKAKPAASREKRRTKEEDEDDERTSDPGDDEDDAPRPRKAAVPPFSQNMIFIGAGIIVALGIVAYMMFKNSGQPQRAAPEPGAEPSTVTLQVPPSPIGSDRPLQPPIMLDQPPGDGEEKEKEAPPEKEKEEEKETEKPTTGAAPKPAPKLGEPPKAPLPKPTAPKPPAQPKPAGDNPY